MYWMGCWINIATMHYCNYTNTIYSIHKQIQIQKRRCQDKAEVQSRVWPPRENTNTNLQLYKYSMFKTQTNTNTKKRCQDKAISSVASTGDCWLEAPKAWRRCSKPILSSVLTSGLSQVKLAYGGNTNTNTNTNTSTNSFVSPSQSSLASLIQACVISPRPLALGLL